MALRGGMQCIKYLLFLFNFFFVVIGVILIWLGVSSKLGWSNNYIGFINAGQLSAPPNIFIAVGVLIFIIAFLGCCGAIRESNWMIMGYAVLVGLILVLELAGAFAAFALRDDVKLILEDGLSKAQHEYGKNTSDYNTKSWDSMQAHLSCCGIHNFTDWQGTYYNHIPTSCCHEDTHNCSDTITWNTPVELAAKTIWTEGCLEKAVSDIAIGTLGIVGLVLAGIELLGIICACCLARSVRYSYETV